MSERTYDVVVFGATGFTGGLTAEYLARRHAQSAFRWAIAGRNTQRLAEVRNRLISINPSCSEVGLIEADVGEPESLRKLAAQTRVVITTVGPYILYGEPLVQACAAAGTDYVDLTGEPEFVDLMIEKYDAAARASGARIVNCCGFDSIPHDLGALFTVRQLPKDRPIRLEGFVRAGGTFSGGTWHSAIHAMARMREYGRQRKSRKTSPATEGRRVRAVASRIRYEKALGTWACPFPTIDPQIVRRSARALPEYGPDFSYGHYVQVKRLPKLLAGLTMVGGIFAGAQFSPTRKLLLSVRDPGQGPSEEQRKKGWFRVRFMGQAGDARVMTEVRGGDPGYGETAKMLAESALCLAQDRQPKQAGGVLTPAVAMGEALITRLQAAGIEFNVVSKD